MSPSGTGRRTTARASGCIAFALCALAAAAPDGHRALVTDLWRAAAEDEAERAARRLAGAAPDAAALHEWLRRGPDYDASAPTGRQERVRTDADGVRFPYVFLVPGSYDPSRPWPVEFVLHGGVDRPAWAPGGGWWRGGLDSLARDDRIVVAPASWSDAFWWRGGQAENLPAILKAVKRVYNVDENRVTMTGVSDGGTGAWFFAFKQPTEWAAFFPYIAHPGVLRNPSSGGGHRLYFENLTAKPVYIVSGENDRLYPAASLESFVEILAGAGVRHVFRTIPGGGHDTRWLPAESPRIERFRRDHPRDPLPETVRWVADRADRYNRNLWIRVDGLDVPGRPGLLEVVRDGNRFAATARGVSAFTLLLSPLEVDFADAVVVTVNGGTAFDGPVVQSRGTLLEWAARDLDRTALYTAELSLEAPADGW